MKGPARSSLPHDTGHGSPSHAWCNSHGLEALRAPPSRSIAEGSLTPPCALGRPRTAAASASLAQLADAVETSAAAAGKPPRAE